jgi:hypothetical protein
MEYPSVGFRSLEYVCSVGMTDDSYVMEDSENMSYRTIRKFFYRIQQILEIKTRLILKIDQDDIMWDKLLEWIFLITIS